MVAPWPRILPTGSGTIERRGLDFYDRLVDGLIARGIAPWLCLYHWDLPQALQDQGGWLNRDIVQKFAEYARIVARRLGDRVKHWAVLNEPNVHALFGHAAVRVGAAVLPAPGADLMAVTLDKPTRVQGRLPRSVGFDRLLLFLALLVLWQVLSWIAGPEVITSPPSTARKLAAIISAPDFVGHAYETGRAFAAALVISLLGGLVIGLALGFRRLAGEVAEPLLVALYSIPKITLYPVILLLFGLGISAKIAFGAIHVRAPRLGF